MSTKKSLAIILCLIVTTIFSLHYIIAKEILSAGVSQYALSAWRGIIGGGVLLLLFRKKLSFRLIKENWFSLLIISALGFFLNQILFMKGLSQTSSLNAAVISNTIPIVTAIVAVCAGLEKVTYRKILGIVITFLFVVYLILDQQKSGQGITAVNLGNLFIFLNVIVFCIAFVFGKKLLKKDFPFAVLTGIMLFVGGVMMMMVAGSEMREIIGYSLGGRAHFLFVLFEIFISTSIAYLFNVKALQLMSATKVSFFIYLQPVITGLLAFFMGASVPTISIYVAFSGILVGGYLVIMQRED